MTPILVDACSLNLIGELMRAIQVDLCSPKLIGELMTQEFSFAWSTLTMMESPRTSSPKDYREDHDKEIIHSTHGVPERFFGYWKTEDGFFNFKSIKEHKGSYSPPDPE